MIYHLDENGTMAVVLPHGVLFRGAAESTIRQYLIEEKNYLDLIVSLPTYNDLTKEKYKVIDQKIL